ncbi:hypothetical protein J4526_04460 [Desulfurococcaceae archaeon MEX13E-LK6-19]|nr:hypothetical protein J4526_04460 [Desulfurococcaceae archaeon MEX13E-LK6-19]
MYVKVEAEVRPTEDVEKVKQAVRNVFSGKIRVVDKGNGYRVVEGESYSARSLIKIYELIRIQRIMDAARKKLQKGMSYNTIVFKLHKQAALANKLSFIDYDNESPLGPILFYIETSDPEKLIDWLAPKTSMGKPLWEISMPED